MTEETKQLLDRAAAYLSEPFHPITERKYRDGINLVVELRDELLKATKAKPDNQPIRKAIRDLRDAIESGEGWGTICKADSVLDDLITESNDIVLVRLYANLFSVLQRQKPTDWTAVEEAIKAIKAACIPPTPVLTGIEKAAEAIEKIHLEHVGGSMTKDALAAIIRQFVEVR